ncbi:MAG: carboxypeptidase-like regulatory domain-containing protein, partial [Planctomycetota bacterium]
GATVRVRMQIPIQGSVPGMDPGKRKNREVEFSADEKGVFLSPPIPLKNPSSFQASLNEVTSGWVKRKPGEDAEVVLELGVLVHVVGKVLDPLGQPIPDARLGRRDSYKAHHVHYMRNVWTVDREGSFDVLVPPKFQEGFWLVASAPGCQPNGIFLENLTAGPPVQATITLQPGTGGRLIGTVRDADGQPVFHARVRARPRGHKETWNTRTDHFGRWWLESLPPGSFTLFVDKPPEGLAGGKIEVQTDRTDLDLVLAGPRFLEVTLLPPPGFPGGSFLADAILQWDGGTRWASLEDLEKPLRFEAPRAGTQVRVAIYPDSRLAPKVEGPFVLKDRDLEEGIRLQLEEGFRIAGRAILPQGAVLAPGSFRARLVWMEESAVSGFGGGSTSDLEGEEHADGSFEFLHVPAGRLQLLLSGQTTQGQPLVGERTFNATGSGQFVEVTLHLGRRRISPQGDQGNPFR